MDRPLSKGRQDCGVAYATWPCAKKNSSGVSCWEAWHAAGGDELLESSKRRSDWLKEEREATRYAKRLRAAEAEAEKGAFWTASAAEPLTGEAGAAEGAGAADGEAQV